MAYKDSLGCGRPDYDNIARTTARNGRHWDQSVNQAFAACKTNKSPGAIRHGGMSFHEVYLGQNNPRLLISWGK